MTGGETNFGIWMELLRTCPRTAAFRAVLKGHDFSRAVKALK